MRRAVAGVVRAFTFKVGIGPVRPGSARVGHPLMGFAALSPSYFFWF